MTDVTQPEYPVSNKVVEKLQPKWSNEPTVADLKADLEKAQPTQAAQVQKINTWRDNLHITGSAKLPPNPGRSTVQPKLIRKQAEWRYTSLSEPFLATDKLFTVSPRTWEDKPGAEQAELLLNWQMDTYLNKVTLVDQMVRTGVDEGTVVLLVGWKRETETQKVKAPKYSYRVTFDPEEIQTLTEMGQLSEEEQEQLPEELRESLNYSIEKGAPHTAKLVGYEEVEQEVVTANHPTLEVAITANLTVDPTCGANYENAMFMVYSTDMSKSDLEGDSRYKNVDTVNWDNTSPLAQPDHVPKGPNDFNFADKARNTKTVVTYYGLWDIKKDGKLRPILAAWIGDTMVRMEEIPFPDKKPPFVIIPLLPVLGSIYGEPDGELLEDNQKIQGAVTRGMLDLMARSANAQRGMAKNMLDVVNKRRFENGQDYEFNPNVHPTNGIVEHKFPEIPMSAMNMIGLVNSEAESLTGVKMFGQGLNGASLGPTATAAQGTLDASSRREMGILRRMAKGLCDAGKKISAMNQVFLTDKEVIRVTNDEFVEVKKEDIQGNFDLKIEIATNAEDEAKASRMEFMLQTLGNNIDQKIVMMILADVARLRRMVSLEQEIKNYKPEPDPIQQKMQELEMAKLEAETAKFNAEAEAEVAAAEYSRARAAAVGSERDLKNLDYVEQETGTKHARRMEEIGSQAKAQTKMKLTDAILNQSNGPGPDGKIQTAPRQQDIVDAARFNEEPPQ